MQKDRIGVARAYATEHRVTLVLKGQRTLIAFSDGRVWINPTGTPALGTGGSGDILTGLIAGLLAQFPKQPDEAVAAAVYLHGLAGEIGARELGREVADRDRHLEVSAAGDCRERGREGVPVRYAPRPRRRRSTWASDSRATCRARAVVLLIGNLGAGKTTLAKGIVQGLGAGDAGRGLEPDIHADPRIRRAAAFTTSTCTAWKKPREVATLGLDELFDREAVVLIEWGERFPQLMPAERIEIRIRAAEDDTREIEVR